MPPEKPEPHYRDDSVTLFHGHCLDVLRGLPADSVDSVVTDPPYGLANTTPAQVADVIVRWATGEREYVPTGIGFMGACLHPATDILTSTGWKSVTRLTVNDTICSLNPETQEIEYVPAVSVHEYDFAGDLLRVGGRSALQVVTPNHRVWANGRLTRADELPSSFRLSNQGSWHGDSPVNLSVGGDSFPSGPLLYFFGLWLGDGYVCHRSAQKHKQDFVGFGVTKPREVQAVRRACQELGIAYTETPDAFGNVAFYIYDKALLAWLSPLGNSHTKHIPEYLFALSTELLENLYRGMMDTDGTLQGRNQEVYYTSSDALADDFQRLCLHTGRSATARWRKPEADVVICGKPVKENFGGWVLSVLRPGKSFWMERDGRPDHRSPRNVNALPYRGKVYCATLARNHVMLSRLDGKTVWTGNSWDSFVPPPAVWDECLRILKPGGHMLVFAGARTQDLMGLSIRLAGFDLRESLAWIYGSGMPKSLDVSKAIDKIGADPQVLADMAAVLTKARETRGLTVRQCDELFCGSSTAWSWYEGRAAKGRVVIQPPNAERAALIAAAWPETAFVFERMRQRGEFVGVRRHQRGGADDFGKVVGVKAVPRDVDVHDHATDQARAWEGYGTGLKPSHEPIILARKPPVGTIAQNVLAFGTGALNIDGCRVGGPDGFGGGVKGSSGFGGGYESGSGFTASTKGRWPANVMLDETTAAEINMQSPGVSKFFYVAKASKAERPVLTGSDGQDIRHPTVKPLTLMRELVRLVTRPGGVVLEPFAGSGTTCEAAVLEGMRCIAVEQEAKYLPLILSRLAKPVQDGLFE